jgi:hypothetical protein
MEPVFGDWGNPGQPSVVLTLLRYVCPEPSRRAHNVIEVDGSFFIIHFGNSALPAFILSRVEGVSWNDRCEGQEKSKVVNQVEK